MTDSSEAFKDGREASDGRSDVGRLERRAACAALCLLLVARALWGSRRK